MEKEKVAMSFNFAVDRDVFEQVKAVADDREWTIQHVLRMVIPLGLAVYSYVNGITLPNLLEGGDQYG